MRFDRQKFRLMSIFWLPWLCLIFSGCDSQPSTDEKSAEPEIKEKNTDYPFPELLGHWQSACNFRSLGRPVMVSIDFQPTLIRWSNHFYFDKACVRSDKVESFQYLPTYIEDVQILGNVWARLFRLQNLPTDEESEPFVRQEIFRAQDGWLYISRDGSGPDFDKLWDIDSNLGLRKVR